MRDKLDRHAHTAQSGPPSTTSMSLPKCRSKPDDTYALITTACMLVCDQSSTTAMHNEDPHLLAVCRGQQQRRGQLYAAVDVGQVTGLDPANALRLYCDVIHARCSCCTASCRMPLPMAAHAAGVI